VKPFTRGAAFSKRLIAQFLAPRPDRRGRAAGSAAARMIQRRNAAKSRCSV
jgi:hypothetical protein